MAHKKSQNISALLITLNEEKNMEEILDNLSFADEIIVVDSFSSDSTAQIVKENGKAKLIQRAFKNYTDQKGFAMEQATHDWILFLDADERVTPELKDEILDIVNSETETASAYYFLRTFMFQDQVLRFSGWQTDKNYRLFRKSKVHFAQDRIVHETLVVDGESKTLKNRLIHYSYSSYEDYKGKMIKYGTMKARDEFKKGKKGSWFHSVFRPTYKFFNHYILRLGFLDGKKGIIICYLNALGVHAKFKELKRLNKQD
jgi:glycosyltransferase involved in cell wall biosynthesis